MDGAGPLRRSLIGLAVSAAMIVLVLAACGVQPDEQEAIANGGLPLAAACPVDPRTGLAVACDGGTADAGRDAGPDGGPRDGGPDGGPRDGGHDGGPGDGGPHDGGPDGGTDGGPPDAGPDGGICEATGATAFLEDAADPGACTWNIPPDTRAVKPYNLILDVGPLNVVGKLQFTDTEHFDRCLDDKKVTGSGSVQACVRYAGFVFGSCGAGSYGQTLENGSCSTPFCACEGNAGECRQPGCSMHKENKQFGAGGGWNVSGNDAVKKVFPEIGKRIPGWLQVNGNLIIQGGGGWGTDEREGSSPCYGCCANGNPYDDDIIHLNAEAKATVFVTARFWNVCFTATFNAGICYQHNFINQLSCDGRKNFKNEDLLYGFGSLGNAYFGLCTGEKDQKQNGRGGFCSYDTTSGELRCGFGWLRRGIKLPGEWHRGNGTNDICLF